MKKLYTPLWVTIVLTFVLSFLAILWLIYPYNPVDFNAYEYEVVNKKVGQDKLLYYKANFCKNTDKNVQVTRFFINDLIYATPSFEVAERKGCYKYVFSVHIPKELPEGSYRIKTVYTFLMNPIKEVSEIIYTDTFEVVKL